MNKSKIEWCDYTWNPVTGCLHGCPYCYARRIAERFGPNGNQKVAILETEKIWQEEFNEKFSEVSPGIHKIDNPHCWNGRVQPYPYGFEPTFHRYKLDEPGKKTKGVNIFVGSMSDLFGEWVSDEWIKQVIKSCENAPQHRYMFLTKNPKRYKESVPQWKSYHGGLQNIWFGTTVTGNNDMQKAFELLNSTLKPINRFLSIEPLLGEINLSRYLKHPLCKQWGPDGNPNEYGKYHWKKQSLVNADWVGIDWVIVGAETGNRKERKIPKEKWVQTIIDQCRAADVPIFLKDNLYWPEKIQEFPW